MTAITDNKLPALYGVHRQELVRFLTARTGDPGEAEDLAQELWLKLPTVAAGPIQNGRSYLFRMALNLVVDRARARQRRMRRDGEWADAAANQRSGMEPVDPSANAEEAMLEREERAALASAIANLPAGARRAFELHKLAGLSHADVATRMAISKSGVEKHMAVAMKNLRRALQD